MARWKLTAPHYLNVPGTTWEYSEVDRITQRPKRVKFDVPQLMDPADIGSCNYRRSPEDGDMIVCHEGKGEPQDIEFRGEPTPDMIPLDDEAKAISARLAEKWKHPIDSLPGTFSDSLLRGFQEELAAVQAKTTPTAAPVEGMTELLTAMAAMMKQNQEMIAALAKPAAAAAPIPAGLRR